jgi:hypothetical protein
MAVAIAGVIAAAPLPLYARQKLVRAGHGAGAQDMRLLGHSDVQARSAYQPVIQRHGSRWIAYIEHHRGTAMDLLTGEEESNGTSGVDVTDPTNPQYLYHIPGEAGGAQMVRLCSSTDLPIRRCSKSLPPAYLG